MSQIVSLRNGRFDQSSAADLSHALDAWEDGGQRLVLHFHGGLVSHEAGIRIAGRLQPLYEDAGAFPLFVVWQSSVGEVIVNNLRGIAEEKIFQRLLLRTLQFVVGKIRDDTTGTRGPEVKLPTLAEVSVELSTTDGEPFAGVEGPSKPLTAIEEKQLAGSLRADSVVQSEAAMIANWLDEDGPAAGRERNAAAGAATATLMSPEVLDEIRTESAGPGERGLITTARLVKGGVATVARTLKRLRSGRDHGVFTTVVEELLREFYVGALGKALWGRMKQDTADAFGKDAGSFGGTAIIDQLAARDWEAPPVLVGHSAGSVYICNFLAQADATLPEQRQFDVVMLAPACDFRQMDATLAKHGERIRRLRIFAMKDENEVADHLLPLVYPRSLLYFVSGLLEEGADWPLLGMERFHAAGPPFDDDAFPEIGRVRAALADSPGSAVWSIAADGDGLASNAISHGGFDDDRVTLTSVCQFISVS
jgi:hypothetical protein